MSMLYSASETVFREVKELILSGELAGGELISEGDIAARTNVSRTPVRERFCVSNRKVGCASIRRRGR